MATVPNQTKLVMLAARGLAELQDDDLRGERLNLELEVSVWLRRTGAELSSVPRSLMALRAALLEASALDAESEPLPLVVADTQHAVANLCVYLHGLIGRAARSVEVDRKELVESALARLATQTAGARRSS
jgi:hypothetical protein